MDASLDSLSAFGGGAKTKLLLLGANDPLPEELVSRARSLKIEHVSPAGLEPRGISHRPGASPGPDERTALALMRRWFFARKPDAGFVLTNFPATLLQAMVLDEWLDVRGESLDAVISGSKTPGPLLDHYRTRGLLTEALFPAS